MRRTTGRSRLVHGATYFDRAGDRSRGAAASGDHLFFTDWRGDPDESCATADRPSPSRSARLPNAASWSRACCGAHTWTGSNTAKRRTSTRRGHRACGWRGACWTSGSGSGGSHHQKLGGAPASGGAVARCGVRAAVSTCATPAATTNRTAVIRRRSQHVETLRRPPAVARRAAAAERAGRRRARHSRSGSAGTTRRRWTRCRRSRGSRTKLRGADLKAGRLPEQPPIPPQCGPHAVQVLRTYPDAHFEYDFAPNGERSVARGYSKAVRRAEAADLPRGPVPVVEAGRATCSPCTAEQSRAASRRGGAAVPDVDGRLALPPNIDWPSSGHRVRVRRPARQRVHRLRCREPRRRTPVYVHAKVCVVDDVWACVGSDNFNRRSWTHDSELSCAVLDDTGEFARRPAAAADA